MLDAKPILHGVVLAFGLILPLGVQNVFVFNQGALQSKFRYALPIVLTASICDTLLITLAVLGISVLLLAMPIFKFLLLGGGILFLLYMGWIVWQSTGAATPNSQASAFPARRQVTFGLMVSLLNPHALLDTIGVIGTGSTAYMGTDKLLFAGSCILVSWIWFILLAWMGRLIGGMDPTGRFLNRLNRISALVMWLAAGFMGYQLYLTL